MYGLKTLNSPQIDLKLPVISGVWIRQSWTDCQGRIPAASLHEETR
jgi:hypothetical protein